MVSYHYTAIASTIFQTTYLKTIAQPNRKHIHQHGAILLALKLTGFEIQDGRLTLRQQLLISIELSAAQVEALQSGTL